MAAFGSLAARFADATDETKGAALGGDLQKNTPAERPDWYAFLGVSSTASQADLREAHRLKRREVLRMQRDCSAAGQDAYAAAMQSLSACGAAIVDDPTAREAYDDGVWATDMHEIVPGVWLGGLDAAQDPSLLRRNGVHTILTVARGLPGVVTGPDFINVVVEVNDTEEQDMLPYLQRCIDLIEDSAAVARARRRRTSRMIKEDEEAAGKSGSSEGAPDAAGGTSINSANIATPGGILVHCFAGASRSAMVVLAWVMQHLRLDLVAAYKLVRAKRPIIDPNSSFMRQLLAFERMGCPRELPKDYGVTVASTPDPATLDWKWEWDAAAATASRRTREAQEEGACGGAAKA